MSGTFTITRDQSEAVDELRVEVGNAHTAAFSNHRVTLRYDTAATLLLLLEELLDEQRNPNPKQPCSR